MSDDESSGSSVSSHDEDDAPVAALSTPKQGIIVPSAFDAYFAQNAARGQTSANVFSSLIPPLSAEEYAEASASFPQTLEAAVTKEPVKGLVFDRMMLALDAGFNVLGYGYGSKRKLLNEFARERCAGEGHVVVANAFLPSFSYKTFLESVQENLPDIRPPQSASIEHQTQAIHEYFIRAEHPIYIIVHNIDALPLRAPKVKACLAQLAMNPHIHLVASVDHINAPLLWSSSEASARKPDSFSHSSSNSSMDVDGAVSDEPTSRGFAWLWHDLTTLLPYDAELAHADRSSISGAQRKTPAAALAAATSGAISETAALHVLASVTQRAKKLFVIIARHQLEAEDSAVPDPGSKSPAKGKDKERVSEEFSIAYDALFNAARDEFIATNDTALRSLLGEFRDHALVVGQENLRIPMRRERLRKVLAKVEEEVGS